MHRGMNKFIQDQVNWSEVDRLAKTNPMVRDKQRNEMLNIMRDMSQFFQYFTEAKSTLYADRLIEKGIGVVALKEAYGEVIDIYEKAPSFKDLLSLCRRVSGHEKKESYYEKELREEDNKALEIEKKWNSLMGEDRLEKFVEWWIKKCMGWDLEEIKSFGLGVMMWKKCALLDWYDSGYAKDISLIVKTAKNKIGKK